MRIGKKVVWVGGRMGRGHWADCVPFVGSYENEDLRHPPPYENENPSRKRRHITKTSSKEVGITFVDKDYVHVTHYENEDPYRNLEF